MLLPVNISTGTVTGQFIVGVRDGADDDHEPDSIPAAGRISFTASVPYLVDLTADPNPVTIMLKTVEGVLDNEGYLCTPLPDTFEPAYRGVKLIATDDMDLSNTDWTWTASYAFTSPGGAPASHSFSMPSGATRDLTTVVRIPASDGIGIEQAEALAASAHAAAVEAAESAATASQAALDAASAAQVTDLDISTLLANSGSGARLEVNNIVAAATADKLDTDTAIETYQSRAALDAAAAAKVSSGGSQLNGAVKSIADASAAAAAAPKLDSATAATTYAAKSVETSKLDASQKATANGVASLDSGGKHPLAQVPDVVQTTSGAKPVGKGEVFVNTNDYATIAAAHTARPDIATLSPGGVNVGSVGNIYGINYNKALGAYQQAGTAAAPTTDAAPIIWTHKYSAADRPGTEVNEWSQGAYHQITKTGGGAYDAAITGYVRNQGGAGQSIGIHGRATGYTVNSDVFGMWAYAASGDPATVPKSIIGMEIDMNNKNPDQGWMDGANVGASRGLIVVGADGSNPLTHGIQIGANSASPNGKFWTGLLMRANGTMPSGPNSATQINNGEQIRLGGATAGADAYNGVRFYQGNFTTGISFAEASFANGAAIVLGDTQRIIVGPGGAKSTYLGFDLTTSLANFNNLSIALNGVQVVKSRRTGWGAATGTVDRTAYAAYAAPTYAAAPTMSDMQTLANQVQANSRHLAALIQDLTTHGLIGA
ncbi:hypothetical protein ACFVTM_13335 [Arthrobacter sp. NPDC058130]|uniref:hypothetical protein n=1 Tax=Arthrobacter sp. NPDC058130 TaxID=3346353 RepID=UPI0036F010A9